jgi:hypothetical protein
MGRAFTHYWTCDSWEGYRGDLVTYTAANLFRRRGLKTGDRIYIVSNLDGRVRLGAAIDVAAVVGRAEAKKRFGREVWDASDFAIAITPVSFDPDQEVPTVIASRLRFLPSGKGLKHAKGRLDQQTLRGLRELTPESAMLLEGVLNGGAIQRSSSRGMGGKFGWRDDPALAGQVLRDILDGLPEKQIQSSLDVLRRDMELADSIDPARWLLTLHKDRVLVICGSVQCLRYKRGGVAALQVTKDSAPKRYLRNCAEFVRAPGCVEIYPSIAELLESPALLGRGHSEAIRICMETSAVSGGHRRAHSSGLVAYLRGQGNGHARTRTLSEGDREILAEFRDLRETEREGLRKYRCAQGLFRDRVAALEKCCRVTGISDPLLLRASHIKPWRLSNPKDRQDGDNGLFLAPHVDALFDRGWISFLDNGDLMVSKRLDLAVLKSWGISYPMNVGSFRPAQQRFLKWHRKAFGFGESE